MLIKVLVGGKWRRVRRDKGVTARSSLWNKRDPARQAGGEAGDELKSLTPHLGSSEEECTHALSGGPLGLEEMSMCALIQAAVPLLMMASTCCFNVTAGSPSIPH